MNYQTRSETEITQGGVHVTRTILVVRIPLLGPQSSVERSKWVNRLMGNLREKELTEDIPGPSRETKAFIAAAASA